MKKLFFLAVVYISAACGWAQNTVTFNVNDSLGRDQVTFTTHASLQTVRGITSKITGHVTLDPDNIPGAADGRFEVDLASLKTGIGMRDRHMREKSLETSKYPDAIFNLLRIVNTDHDTLLDQTPINLTAEGDFTVHGITKRITVPLKVTYMKESGETAKRAPGNLLHIEGTFDLLLSDYNIPRPRFMFFKVDDKQRIDIDAVASTGLPPLAAQSK